MKNVIHRKLQQMTLDHDKSLQVYFFCVKRQAKNDFLKDVKSTVVRVYKVVKLCNMSKG